MAIDNWMALKLLEEHDLEINRPRYIPGSEEHIAMIMKSGNDLNILQIIAVTLLSDFKHEGIHKLVEEFEKPEYDNFCPGSEELRKFLRIKAMQAAQRKSLRH
jgi:hypothetical protein